MIELLFRAARIGVLALLAISSVVTRASADSPQEYEFQLVAENVLQAQDVVISVRLTHKPTGKAVPDAVVFARRLDMAPDGMPTMTADLEAVSSEEPGVYRFRTSLGMEGNWRLSLAAKIQGVKETVQARLVLKAKK
jgi:hypothetical protein